MTVFLLRWFISWCTLLQGFIGILTLGCWRPSIELWAARKYSRAKFKKKYDDNAFIMVQK